MTHSKREKELIRRICEVEDCLEDIKKILIDREERWSKSIFYKLWALFSKQIP